MMIELVYPGTDAYNYDYVPFEELIGQQFDKVVSDQISVLFFQNDQLKYVFAHWQDCCEQVELEDVVGDLNYLENTPILKAETSSQRGSSSDIDSSTWTFYKLATVKGWVDFRFYGTSNGYYSEKAYLYKATPLE